MPVEEVTFGAKLFGFLEASLKWRPGVANDDIGTLLGLLEQHSAIYEDYLFELVGKTANSIRELRRSLETMQLSDGFAHEAQGLVRLACADFTAKAEALSAQCFSGSDWIYGDDIRIGDLPPDIANQFTLALGEFRHGVKIVLDTIHRRGVMLPPGLERLFAPQQSPSVV